jgi:hypothetical protein
MKDTKRSSKKWLRFFLGSYTPPEFILIVFRFFSGGAFSALLNKALSPAKHFFRTRRVLAFSLLGLVVALIGVVMGLRFYESRKPQPIIVRVAAHAPENATASREARPLVLEFAGSASPVDMANREVSGGIDINPPIKGLWRWEGDNALIFTPEGPWPMGKRFTVSFAPDFFPPHIRVVSKSATRLAATISFLIEDFSVQRGESEFYLDPQDSSIKRVLATIRTNYPMDPASVDQNISIEPQIDADSGSLKKKRYGFTVSYNNDYTEAYIVSEPLGMPAKDVAMQINIKRGIRDARGEGSPGEGFGFRVTIPGMTAYVRIDNFSHELVKNESQRYDQVFVLSTRGTISPGELAKNIGAWELPADRPELPGLRGMENYSWNSTELITAEVLALSRKLDLEAIPGELAYNAVNSFKFSAEPDRYVYVKLNNGAQFYGGYVLNEAYETTFRVKSYPRELAILSEGSILSFSGEKRLAMMSRGISAIRYRIGRIRPDDLNHLASQINGDMLNVNFRNYSFNQYNITEQDQVDADIPLANDGDLSFFSFDFSRYLDNIPAKNLRHGLFIFTLQSRDGDYFDRRLILVTDLGFLVKTNADGSRDLFVQSIATGEPVGGAAVAALGLNGNPILSGYSDSGGLFHIPDLSDYKNEHAPTVYTVRSGEDMSFMPYGASGRSLDYSSFDVGGIRGASDPKTLRAFLFSDRGLYRPGDEVRRHGGKVRGLGHESGGNAPGVYGDGPPGRGDIQPTDQPFRGRGGGDPLERPGLVPHGNLYRIGLRDPGIPKQRAGLSGFPDGEGGGVPPGYPECRRGFRVRFRRGGPAAGGLDFPGPTQGPGDGAEPLWQPRGGERGKGPDKPVAGASVFPPVPGLPFSGSLSQEEQLPGIFRNPVHQCCGGGGIRPGSGEV